MYVSTPLCWGVHVPFKSRFQTIKDLDAQTVAISREASGSHLMSFVMAYQNQLKAEKLNFNVVGDVYGGLWALENREAQVFLWEKLHFGLRLKQNEGKFSLRILIVSS